MSFLDKFNVPQMRYLARHLESASEGAVNGLWNTAFHQYFAYRAPVGLPERTYLLQTEAHPPGLPTHRADIILSRQTYSPSLLFKWSIVCEGKVNSNVQAWDVILTQAARYAVESSSNGDILWIVGARGRTVRFWRFRRVGNDSYDAAELECLFGAVVVGPDVRRVLPALTLAKEEKEEKKVEGSNVLEMIEKLARVQGVYDIAHDGTSIRAILNDIQPLHI
ncbi:hypothetical protein SISSUDRAFT_1119594 [Sistotremastrum suecicum HHB10207 ss-3]|uniref:Uncharacterized protein n=1 Tax=Sistotremastrum suecicum HHB10207 ss-3 TaxID=1314776 RepID=A0A166DFY6_9AGAM|nr:hypothetical protein SISSUDRAFT_1119594 [Sistotremastrum suecicum HHB10207 ss-3]